MKLLSLLLVMGIANSQTLDPSLPKGPGDGPLAPPLPGPSPPDPNGTLVPPLPDPNGPPPLDPNGTPPPDPNAQPPSSGNTSPRVQKCKKKKKRSRYLVNKGNGNHRQALRNAKGQGISRSSSAVQENDFDYFYFYPDGRYLQVDPNANPPSDPRQPLPELILSKYYDGDPVFDPAPKAASPKAKEASKKKGKNNTGGGGKDGGWCPGQVDGNQSPTHAPNAPTISPKPSYNKKACQALENNEPPEKTSVSVEVIFRYNMIRKKTVAAADAIKTVSDFIQRELAGALLGCPSSMVFTTGNVRTLLEHDTHILAIGPGRVKTNGNENHRSLQVGTVTSFEQSGSGSVNPNVACSSNIQGLQSAATNCEAVDDSVTVYLVPNSASSSPTSATDDTLSAIRNLMNNQGSAIMASNNGIQGLLFLGKPGSTDNVYNPPPRIEGNTNPSSSSRLSGAGKGLIIGSCLLLLIIAIVAIRRRRVTQYRTKTAYEEDDVSLFSKTIELYSKIPHGDTDTVSTTSSNWRRARGAHVMGEGDSVSPHDTGSIMDDLRDAESRSLYVSSPRSGGLDDDLLSRDSHDVHRCQSATCDVCAQRRGLVFVPTSSPESYRSIRSPDRRSYQPHDTVHL